GVRAAEVGVFHADVVALETGGGVVKHGEVLVERFRKATGTLASDILGSLREVAEVGALTCAAERERREAKVKSVGRRGSEGGGRADWLAASEDRVQVRLNASVRSGVIPAELKRVCRQGKQEGQLVRGAGSIVLVEEKVRSRRARARRSIEIHELQVGQ